jgi:hypothetical protein
MMDGRLFMVVLWHLLPHVSEKLLGIWNGSPSYKGHVRTFLAEGGAKQMHWGELPPYEPHLNPGEGV